MDLRAELWIAIFCLFFLLVGAGARRRREPMPWIYLLFFCSGFPALIYQIVWQRALFGIYGVNVESVTIVVSAFMFGLGLGSLLGGALSKRLGTRLLPLFALAELGTAAFGLASLKLFHWVAEFTAGSAPLKTGLVSFALVVIPTVLMGATLPLLVEHLVRTSRNVGFAVGGLYFANTLGSAAACFVAGDVLMRLMGQTGSVRFAAMINVMVGTAALVYGFTVTRKTAADPPAPDQPQSETDERWLPFPLALGCAAFAGFLALAYEIIWYRMLSFASSGIARVFAFLLGSYLIGVAVGSRLVERYSQHAESRNRAAVLRRLGFTMLASAIVSFAIAPLCAYVMHFASVYRIGGASLDAYWAFLPFIGFGALLFGATFPLISHAAIRPGARTGAELSYLYAANILGSTVGSFVVGFVLMDYLSLGTISYLLLAGGVVVATCVLAHATTWRIALKNGVALGLASACFAFLLCRPVFNSIYDRLLFKKAYPRLQFAHVVENRSGVIAVTPDGTVYGGGVYDGHFNTDPMHDVNVIARAYAISAFHPSPRHVLMVGLASGSWAQVIAANPDVEELTIVEINPGYLELIPKYPAVASLLRNPKVHIDIDDGRRWLLKSRDRRFDMIVMNTTFYWRDHSTNLLSTDFLQIVRSHLNPGGVLFYNPTGSNDVMATGLTVFKYGLRFTSCLAVSDSPIVFDREHWRSVLATYRIDDKPVFNLNDPEQAKFLDHMLNIPVDPTGQRLYSIEEDDHLRRRLHDFYIFTDDNMGVEWRG